MSAFGFIFARGGSKGLPRKNILDFHGKPLIGWSIEQAKEVKNLDRIIVSTDSNEIASIALYYGAEVPFIRPPELSGDASSELMAWRHALEFCRDKEGYMPDTFVSIPTTSPLRLSSDITECIEDFYAGGADIVISISKSDRNPYFNMVKIDEQNYASLLIQSNKVIANRQQAPIAYNVSTVAYVADSNFVLSADNIFAGKVRGHTIPSERAVDIDTKLDFAFAEYLMSRRIKI
jgi:CMP-N-acetylneuraminic acid synthetase